VLRHDGVLVLNLGDSYAGSGKGPTGHNGIGDQEQRQGFTGISAKSTLRRDGRVHTGPYDGEKAAQPVLGGGRRVEGLPPKNLLMIPFRVAMALQADGWILRSVMPWVKRNSMPESVTDRPASAIEYLFMFARSERYFWDAEAIRQEHAPTTTNRRWVDGKAYGHVEHQDGSGQIASGGFGTTQRKHDQSRIVNPAGRSYRNSDPFFATWQGLMLDEAGDPLALIVNPQPNPLAHFASFSPKLVEPFVRAATSQVGACPACRAPWRRVVERERLIPAPPSGWRENGKRWNQAADTSSVGGRTTTHASGWAPSCSHDAGDPVPCVVLDPFAGSGTSGLVSERLGRDSILIELSPTYAEMARGRIYGEAPMFNQVEVG
jgi:hypothetical protein